MKKLIQLIASIFIVISMTACSSKQPTNDTSTKTTETKQLLDLSGKWIQETKKMKDIWLQKSVRMDRLVYS